MHLANEDIMLTKTTNPELNLEIFHKIAISNVKQAVSLAMQYPQIANLLTFEYFHTMVKEQPAYAIKLAKVPSLNNLIDNKEKFIKICSLNFKIASALLIHPNIAKIAEPIKAFMPYYYYNQHTLRIREKRLASPAIAALDLAETKFKMKKGRLTTMEVSKPSTFDRMNLETLNKANAINIFLRKFPTLKKYCDLMMYGPSGYYTTGKVDFTNHISTFASVPKFVAGFSAAMAQQLYYARKNLILENKLKPTDQFNVLECGGGNGDLCFNILETISKMAQQNEEWKQLFQNLHYHLVDLSPELVKRQKERNHKFAEKITVIQGDARTLVKEMACTQIAVVLSNELLDMFAPHELLLSEEGKITVGMMLPYIRKHSSNEYFIQALKKSGLSLTKLIADSDKYKALYLMLCPDDNKMEIQNNLRECLLLSERSFLKLHKITANEKICPELFNFIRTHIIDAQWIPEVVEFLKRNPLFSERMIEQVPSYSEIGIHKYLEMLYTLVIPGGEIISVDYGNNQNLLRECLRANYQGKINLELREKPGFIDITKDVNFSTLAREGELLGFEPLFFGEQSQLNINCFPPSILSSHSTLFFQNVSQERSDLKVMVQQKRDGDTHNNLANRFIGNSKPVKYDELFSEVQNEIKPQTKKQKEVESLASKNRITNNQASLYQDLSPLLKRYNLPDSTQLSLEKGLRNAATNNKIGDLKILIKLVKNINAQDNNPERKCTALHWAAIKNHREAYNLLIAANANPNIPDVKGKTPEDYLRNALETKPLM
jgi:SAM-dependent MidA family methyltransferase